MYKRQACIRVLEVTRRHRSRSIGVTGARHPGANRPSPGSMTVLPWLLPKHVTGSMLLLEAKDYVTHLN